MRTRIISASVLVALVLIALFFASEWLVALIVAGVTYGVLYELLNVFKLKQKRSLTAVNFIFAAIFMLLGYFKSDIVPMVFLFSFVLYVMTLLVTAVLDNKEVSFNDAVLSLFLVVYSVVLLMHITFIRMMDNGILILIFAFIGAYITDSGAYFAGIFLGKHKLIESISPKKTIEGAIGGLMASVLGFFLYSFILNRIGYQTNMLNLLILSVLSSLAAQLGDLSASLMKRSIKIKDFGNLIPGHGGLLDRVDSLMFVIPLVYYYMIFLPVIK